MLVGMPEWENFDLDITYLLNLNLVLFSPDYVDYSSRDIMRFIDKYREEFKGEPLRENYSFDGFDITYFFLTALKTYGKDFEKCIQDLKINGLIRNYHFIRKGSGGFENNSVNIYQYVDYKRIKVK
jgi:hypothetical protein